MNTSTQLTLDGCSGGPITATVSIPAGQLRDARSISTLIRDTINGLYDLFQDTAEEAWQKVPRYKPLDEAQLAATLVELRSAELSDSRMSKARDEDCARAEEGDWNEFLKKGLAGKVAQDELVFYRKPIPEAVVAIYRRLLDHAKFPQPRSYPHFSAVPCICDYLTKLSDFQKHPEVLLSPIHVICCFEVNLLG